MKKSIRVILAMLLFSLSYISCTNNETDEDLQLFQNQELFADDTGGNDNPPPPPDDPEIAN